MQTADYNYLKNYASKILRQRAKASTMEGGDIVNNVFINSGFTDIESFKKNILNEINKEAYSIPSKGDDFKEKIKTCSKCHEDKPASAFAIRTNGDKTFIAAQCKDCHNEHSRKYRQEARKVILVKSKIRNAEYNQRDYVKKVRATRRYKDLRNEKTKEYRKKNIEKTRENGKKAAKKYRERIKGDKSKLEAIQNKNKERWRTMSDEDRERQRQANKIASKKYYENKKKKIIFRKNI